MSEAPKSHPPNVPGKYYVDRSDCRICCDCLREAKHNFALDTWAYVAKQPASLEEDAQVRNAIEACCEWAIHGDGDLTWKSVPKIQPQGGGSNWSFTVISPKTFCSDSRWAFNSNVILAVVHRSDAHLPDFDELFAFWQFREDHLEKVMITAPQRLPHPDLSVSVNTLDCDIYPLFDLTEQGTLSFRRPYSWDLGTSLSATLPVVMINDGIGLAAFSLIDHSYGKDISKRNSVLVRLNTLGIIISEGKVDVDFARKSTFQLTKQDGEMCRRIYASYAAEDKEIIEHANAFLRALNSSELIWDAAILHGSSGDQWSLIREAIQKADCFQLFWSKNAKTSKKVRKEWSIALELGKEIRVFSWESEYPRLPKPLNSSWISGPNLRSSPLKTESALLLENNPSESRILQLEKQVAILKKENATTRRRLQRALDKFLSDATPERIRNKRLLESDDELQKRKLSSLQSELRREKLNEFEKVYEDFFMRGRWLDESEARQAIENHFGLEDIEVLCHDMQIDYDNISRKTKELTIVSLINYCRRRGKYSELIGRCLRLRGHEMFRRY